MERKEKALEQLRNQFRKLKKNRDLVFACEKEISGNRIKNILTNLFDSIYSDRIPFPFDGFHTIKGNAAKDCQLFTTELFSGNLNQAWISARKVQQRNRAVTVLHESWQALARDGSIRKKPGNQRVGRIVDWLDHELKQAKRLNLGSIVRQLCKPPFGCNIASAGMLIGVFVAARKELIALTRKDVTIGMAIWLQDAFQGNFLNMAALDETNVQLVSEEESGEWNSLLDGWDLERTYFGQKTFLEKAIDLERQIPIPPSLYYRYELFKDRASEAVAIVEKWNNRIEQQFEHLQRAYERENAGNLSRGAASLIRLKQEMLSKEEAWTKEQFDQIESLIQRARQAAVQFFQKWLQTQVVIDPKAVGEYKHRMLKLIGENLKIMELHDEFQQL